MRGVVYAGTSTPKLTDAVLSIGNGRFSVAASGAAVGHLRPAGRPAAGCARGLRVRGRVSLRELATRGLRMELLTPADSRLIDLRLTRVSGRKLKVALDGRVKIRKGGPIVVRWTPGTPRARAPRRRCGARARRPGFRAGRRR